MMITISRSRFWRRFLPGFLSFVCVFVFAACSGDDLVSQQTDQSPAAGETPVLTVATSPNFPPFEFTDTDGTLTGFDIDLMNAVGQAAGFTVQFEQMDLIDEVIRSLYSESVDAAIYAISITPERAEVVNFSRPYFKSGLAIATNDPNTITSPATLSGKRIGVESGSTGEATARTIAGATVKSFDTASIALEKLADGKVDAVINDIPVTNYVISNQFNALKIVGEPLTEEYYGIAMPQNSPYLEQINTGLNTILTNGQYAEIYRKWFNAEPPPLPEKV